VLAEETAMSEDTTDATRPAHEIDAEALWARYQAERDKRLREDGSAQYITPTGQFAHYLDDPYVDAEPPRAAVSEDVEVALIGAGFGNIQAAVHLLKAGIEDFRIIDRAGDFGGVWYWNRYPGIACDIDSYVYLPMLEEMGYMPTEKYARGPETFQYARSMATKFDLYRRALLRTETTELRWDEAACRWLVSTAQGDVIRARFVNLATGPLQRPRLPGIPGIESFKGHSFHTSRWDYGYTGGDAHGGLVKLADKRVGIIGTGATAVQAVPHLGRHAKQLHVFQRTPAPVPPRDHKPTDPEWAKSLEPGWQQRRMDNFCTLVSGGRADEDLVADGWTEIKRFGIELDKMKDDAARRQMADFIFMENVRDRVAAIVKDKATAEALKPWYNAGCKRPCFHDDYLQTFNLPNVTLVDTKGRGVERITENAVVVDGRAYEVDCLIYATGFDFNASNMASRNGFEIYGRGGRSLTEKWREGGIATLYGFSSRGFPNLVIQTNAQGAVTSSITHSLGEGGKHLAYLVKYARDHQVRTLEPAEQAERDWVDHVRSRKYRTKHDQDCTPGYFNNDGQPVEGAGINAFYPGSPQKFFAMMDKWRAEGDLAGMEVSRG
jgi:cyclohexanone monooxygenase